MAKRTRHQPRGPCPSGPTLPSFPQAAPSASDAAACPHSVPDVAPGVVPPASGVTACPASIVPSPGSCTVSYTHLGAGNVLGRPGVVLVFDRKEEA